MGKGFQLQRRTARLTFIGNTPLAGAEVMVRLSVPVADVLALQELSESQEAASRVEALRLFSEKMLVSWDLEDEQGTAIPTQPEGMLKIPAEEAALIISGWVEALGKVPGPLGVRSPNGATLVEEPMPAARS